jgi:hypothetical protein
MPKQIEFYICTSFGVMEYWSNGVMEQNQLRILDFGLQIEILDMPCI